MHQGSFQFTTAALLSGVAYGWEVTHILNQDVESFVWVLGYVAMKRLLRTVALESQEAARRNSLYEREEITKAAALEDIKHREIILTDMFHKSFGQMTLKKILNARLLLKPFDFVYEDNVLSTAEATFNLPMRRVIFNLSRNIRAEVERLHDIVEVKNGAKFIGETLDPDFEVERPEQGLKHDFVLGLIETTIQELQQSEGAADIFTSTSPEAGRSNNRCV